MKALAREDKSSDDTSLQNVIQVCRKSIAVALQDNRFLITNCQLGSFDLALACEPDIWLSRSEFASVDRVRSKPALDR